MNFNEIQELIKLMNKSNLSEFKMKEKDFEILIRTEKYHKGTPTVIAAPAATPSVSVTSAPQMIATAIKCQG
jgi:acetyl-CoA carboxylase biotin carboxyl carrier protein